MMVYGCWLANMAGALYDEPELLPWAVGLGGLHMAGFSGACLVMGRRSIPWLEKAVMIGGLSGPLTAQAFMFIYFDEVYHGRVGPLVPSLLLGFGCYFGLMGLALWWMRRIRHTPPKTEYVPLGIAVSGGLGAIGILMSKVFGPPEWFTMAGGALFVACVMGIGAICIMDYFVIRDARLAMAAEIAAEDAALAARAQSALREQEGDH
jgi:hypothetical protein